MDVDFVPQLRAVVAAFTCGFVLDGVLIGAGDGRYLALAGVIALVLFVPMALSVLWFDGGVVALWWAFGGYMLLRLLTLMTRERSDAWLVTGATR